MQKYVLMLLLAVAGTGMFAGSTHAASSQPTGQNQKPKHVVASGETLSSIAADNQLDSWRPIWNANADLANPDLISQGEQLIIPDPGQPTTDRPLPDGYGQAAAAVMPAASSGASQHIYHHSSAPISGDIFGRIRMRESGGNYAENTGNGYYGAYQFDDRTWGGYGGYQHASDAPAAVQDQKAAATYSARGCSPWPNTCY